MPANHGEMESRLWAAADQLWANSNLKPSQFSGPVLGLIFLRYADHRFTAAEKEKVKDDPRFALGMPSTDNANYLWIQIFYHALNAAGRAGFVMANSAADARGGEMEIRKKLIQSGAVDVMVSIGPNFFYTVTLPCTLWFMDKAKAALSPCPPSPRPSPRGRGGYYFQGLVEQARELRRKQTPAEEALWQLLRNRQLADLKFRRQHQIGDYIVDFFCAEHGLVVELDGPVHADSKRMKHDAKRDAYLCALGHTVLRFPNARVFENTETLLSDILAQLPSPPEGAARAQLPSPPGRGAGGEGVARVCNRDTVLFLDARHLFRQIDRAHRDFTPEQIAFLAGIVRLYRGEDGNGYTFDADGLNLGDEQAKILKSAFGSRRYKDAPGLCRIATVKDIEAQGWSLNPGRYVGVAPGAAVSDEDFKEQLEELNEELEQLNVEARNLEERISENVESLLGA